VDLLFSMKNLKHKLLYQLYKYISSILDFGEELDRYNNFRKSAILHSSVKILPHATIENLSGNPQLIRIGANSVIKGQLLIFAHGGQIEIGKDSYLGDRTYIWSADSIKIGDRVLISHSVNIHDTNSHSRNKELRHQHFINLMSQGHPVVNDVDIKSKSILIEDDVWIGFNSTILKGVRIGEGSIVAASSVVTKDIPEFSIVAGNPAKVIRKL
jgi:maltose O-acetyltransferase